MKNTFLKVFGMGTVLILLFVAAGLGQPRVTANIPFAFQVGNQILPAGEYEVGPAQNRDTTHLWVKKLDGSAATNIISFPRNCQGNPKSACLIFTLYGEKYFLSQVWTGTEATGRQLYPSKAEKELAVAARSQASLVGASPAVVTIAAK